MIYMDHHATTPVDSEVIEVMLPMMTRWFANPGSISHEAGREARELVEKAISDLASYLGANADEVILTSGATESINLAVFGVCLHPRQRRRKIVSVATEHRAMLDPLDRLERNGWEVVRLPVYTQGDPLVGQIDLELLRATVDANTAMVSVMWANNEIGVLQPIDKIAQICRPHDVVFHCDATQAMGKFPFSFAESGCDLVSFSGHKLYGPRGIGILLARSGDRPVRLYPQIVGGGQQKNLRSGTLNPPAIVGLAKALQISCSNLDTEPVRLLQLRDRLWSKLKELIPEVELNGPALDDRDRRLPGNLNVWFPGVEGQSLMLAIPGLCVSSGSACTAADPKPSHVLTAIGLPEDRVRASLRFGLGRGNTSKEVDMAVQLLATNYRKLC